MTAPNPVESSAPPKPPQSASATRGLSSRAGSLTADEASVERFLQLHIRASIQLASIPAEGGAPRCRWFGGDAQGAAAWAAAQNAQGRNIYWTVNRAQPGLNRKPTKADISSVRFAHVDIDPPQDGAPFDKDGIALELSAAKPSPSLIVDSGGGLQAFWTICGEVTQDEIERINNSITIRFGGDHCGNIDRLMRLPGTVNYPNAKKRATGRIPVLAKLILSADAAHSAREMAQAFAVPDRSPDTLRRAAIVAGSSLHRLLTEPLGLDRSKDTYAAACELVRSGYDDGTMMHILLDPELPISAHCLDQADPERAARRAIDKARRAVPPAPTRSPQELIRATPYPWPDPRMIPQRRWLYGRQLLRGTLAVIVAPGGMGKTALTVGMALSLATGRPLLGKEVPEGAKSVWLWNLEDSRDELDRAIAAACQHHEIRPADVAGHLFVDSGLEGAGLCTATQTREGHTVLQPIYDALLDEIRTREIDVLIVDPFVSSHQVAENDNGAVDAVAKGWARVAAAANCTIVLVHHTAKAGALEITAERARGAVALVNAARSVLALNRMDTEEARRLGVSDANRRRYFRAFDDKNNRAPPAESSDWYHIESVILPNGGGSDFFGDSVGVVASWTPPAARSEPLETTRIVELQTLIAGGEWRESDRAEQWVGKAVGQAFDLDWEHREDRQRIKLIIKQCVQKGWLRPEQRRDRHREMRTWIVVGEQACARSGQEPSIEGKNAAVPQHCSGNAAASAAAAVP